jgi:2-polyprenyl-3-methyl-5-hydroxy-6-metoxy-1,4-benzoquinol methylase
MESASWFARATRSLAAHGARAPLAGLLSRIRHQAADRIVERHRAEALRIGDALDHGDRGARDRLCQLGDTALSDMRQIVVNAASNQGLVQVCAASVDSWWHRPNAREYLDDEAVDTRLRVAILEDLDALNSLLGSYRLFFDRLRTLARGEQSLRVLDLAAGHGGFALALARLATESQLDLRMVASDIKREYLEVGRARAVRLGAKVDFVIQDALDLSTLPSGEFDVVTCTQSLHHFSPGQVVVMLTEAARVASRGVLFIDGARGALTGAFVSGFGLLFYRNLAFAHDALVSFRRFYVPEELELLGRLCPRGLAARATWTPPSHCALELVCA